MKLIKLNQPVLIPKVGSFVAGQEMPVSDVMAIHIVKNMKAGELLKDLGKDEAVAATQTDIIKAISQLDSENEQLWTADNKPTVEALELILQNQITAEQRDEAFSVFIQQ